MRSHGVDGGYRPTGIMEALVSLARRARHVNERISIDPRVCHGQACIRGTRIPVYQVVRMLSNGDTIEGLLEAYPSIVREDILACLDYAATLAEEQVTPVEPALA